MTDPTCGSCRGARATGGRDNPTGLRADKGARDGLPDSAVPAR